MELTHEKLLESIHYDPETGVFTRLKSDSHSAVLGLIKGNPMGAGYKSVRIGGNKYYMHRLAWFYVHGAWPRHNIDHINGDRTDNRIANLRDVTQAENLQNMRRPKAYSSTGMLGVAKFRSKFRAEIRINGKKKHLGVFDTAEAAHAAYMSAKPRRSAWLDRLMKAMRAKDAEGVEEALEEGQKAMDEESDEEREKREAAERDGKTADAIAALAKTVKALDRKVSRLAARDAERESETEDDDEEDDETDETTDTIIEAEPSRRVSEEGVDLYTGDSARLIAARAEILAPGVKLPTLDGLKTKDRAAALCKCQRRALDQAYETDAGRAAIAPFLGRRAPDFDTMPAPVVDARATSCTGTPTARVSAGPSPFTLRFA